MTQLDPRDKEVFYAKGYCLSVLLKYEEALDSYNKAIELDPVFVQALLGQWEDMRTHWSTSIESWNFGSL